MSEETEDDSRIYCMNVNVRVTWKMLEDLGERAKLMSTVFSSPVSVSAVIRRAITHELMRPAA